MTPTAFQRAQLLLIGIAGLGAIMCSLVLGSGLQWQLWLLLPMVAFLGLAHGCFDLEIARRLRPLPTLSSVALFVAAYVGLAAVVIGLWLAFPGPALGLFLAYSAFHFGSDWRDELGHTAAFLYGIAIVALPGLAFQTETALILGYLAPAHWATGIAATLQLLAGAALPLCLIAMALRKAPRVCVVEFIALVVLALFCPPLIYFAIYFCLSHSIKHLSGTLRFLRLPAPEALRRALPVWLATCAFAAIAAAFATSGNAEKNALRIVFIGLAALTVPHMALVELSLGAKSKNEAAVFVR